MKTPDSPPAAASAGQAGEELKRGLTNRHLQMIAIGGAIGTGLFNGAGRTISLAGPSIILVYIVIGFFLYFVMRALGEMLLSNLKFKSFRDAIEYHLGPWAGFVSGWTYWLCWILIALADMMAVTNYVLWWFPDLPKFIPALAMIVILFVLNIVAVRLFGEIEFWFALIKIVAIFALIVVAIVMIVTAFHSDLESLFGTHRQLLLDNATAAVASGNDVAANQALIAELQGEKDALTSAYPNGVTASVMNIFNLDGGGVFPNGMWGFLAGFQIAFYSFEGIELVGTAAAETRNPLVALPKAIRAIPVRVVFFYVLSLAAILAITPYLAIDPDMSPFVNMFALTGLGIAASVVNFVVLTSAASSMNSGIYSTSRMLFGLAGTRLAPKLFGRLSRSQVPANALIFSCICVLPAIGLLYASGSIMEAFTYASAASNLLFVFVWTLMMVAYLRFRKTQPELHASSVFKMPWGIPMTWVVLGFFAVMLVVLCLDRTTLFGALTAVGLLAILGVIYWVRARRLARIGGATDS
ncbi:MAG: amino acid permease [Propionibacteriaceae bacterium]|jgi:D-serine/D-alanine/glycine transporter|nr:amino acid permease [Propionibacteriaceae bacterium]